MIAECITKMNSLQIFLLRGECIMNFLSAIISYGILLLIFVAVGAFAIFVGITLRKRKDAAKPAENPAEAKNE